MSLYPLMYLDKKKNKDFFFLRGQTSFTSAASHQTAGAFHTVGLIMVSSSWYTAKASSWKCFKHFSIFIHRHVKSIESCPTRHIGSLQTQRPTTFWPTLLSRFFLSSLVWQDPAVCSCFCFSVTSWRSWLTANWSKQKCDKHTKNRTSGQTHFHTTVNKNLKGAIWI